MIFYFTGGDRNRKRKETEKQKFQAEIRIRQKLSLNGWRKGDIVRENTFELNADCQERANTERKADETGSATHALS